MPRDRRLRRLEPDDEPLRRSAGGETLRELAADYGVSHTTLSRYLRRSAVVRQLKRAEQLIRAEQRAAEARCERPARRRRAASPRTPGSPPRRPFAGARAAGCFASTAPGRTRTDERDARVAAAPEQRVRLVTESGETIASTTESNAERMTAALEPHYGKVERREVQFVATLRREATDPVGARLALRRCSQLGAYPDQIRLFTRYCRLNPFV